VQVGDLVRFTPESWGTPLEDRPLGIVIDIGKSEKEGVRWVPMVTVLFPPDDNSYSSRRTDFEIASALKTFI
jgi:hypothetical protein